MIKLKDIFPQLEGNLEDYKVHLATGKDDKEKPLKALKISSERFKEFQDLQTKRNFERNYIIALIYYGPDDWIFGGIYKINNYKQLEEHLFKYDTELLDIQKDLIGRLIIRYNKSERNSYRDLETIYDKLKVIEILRKKIEILEFPGYENVNIDYSTMKLIITKEEKSWKTALENLKGIYLISDISNGKLYAGAAYGEKAFWKRWSDYASNGTGGNKDLIKILEEQGRDHASNFNFSILEIHSKTTDDDVIKKRESHWMDILQSREFGYNFGNK